MKLLLATFFVGIVSSVFPLVNMELYVGGIAATIGDLNIWLVALAGGLGQAVGKIPWYEVSRSSMNWSFVRKRMARPDWQRRYDKVRQQTEAKPWLGVAFMFSSSLIAVPPLAITAVLAGQLEFSRILFYLTIVSGRTLQFAALLGGVSWLADL